jgi:hypothetical protein
MQARGHGSYNLLSEPLRVTSITREFKHRKFFYDIDIVTWSEVQADTLRAVYRVLVAFEGLVAATGRCG